MRYENERQVQELVITDASGDKIAKSVVKKQVSMNGLGGIALWAAICETLLTAYPGHHSLFVVSQIMSDAQERYSLFLAKASCLKTTL
jgi:hypothetical protein